MFLLVTGPGPAQLSHTLTRTLSVFQNSGHFEGVLHRCQKPQSPQRGYCSCYYCWNWNEVLTQRSSPQWWPCHDLEQQSWPPGHECSQCPSEIWDDAADPHHPRGGSPDPAPGWGCDLSHPSDGPLRPWSCFIRPAPRPPWALLHRSDPTVTADRTAQSVGQVMKLERDTVKTWLNSRRLLFSSFVWFFSFEKKFLSRRTSGPANTYCRLLTRTHQLTCEAPAPLLCILSSNCCTLLQSKDNWQPHVLKSPPGDQISWMSEVIKYTLPQLAPLRIYFVLYRPCSRCVPVLTDEHQGLYILNEASSNPSGIIWCLAFTHLHFSSAECCCQKQRSLARGEIPVIIYSSMQALFLWLL